MRPRGQRQRTPRPLVLGTRDDLDVKHTHTPTCSNPWSLAGGAFKEGSGTIWKWGIAEDVGHMVKGGVAFYKLVLLLSHRDVSHTLARMSTTPSPSPACRTVPSQPQANTNLCSFALFLPGNGL